MRSAVIILVVLAVAAFVIAAHAASKQNKADVAQGDYLVNRVALCWHCHTPMTKDGKPDEKRKLAGAALKMKSPPNMPKWASKVPNLTPAGPLKAWSDASLEKFMMTGIAPDGSKANPPMPQYRLNSKDAKGVTAYLRSLPAVR
jgi:hypothetical protein